MRSSLLLALCFASASALTLRESKSLEAAPTRSLPKFKAAVAVKKKAHGAAMHVHVEAKEATESFSRNPDKAVEGDDMETMRNEIKHGVRLTMGGRRGGWGCGGCGCACGLFRTVT